MAEKKNITIDKSEKQPHSLDFKFLRQHGIALIQRLSGNKWTDYNLHDPGVTILELLCFAITDLGYRTNFPIEDLLADPKGDIRWLDNAFFPKETILTTNPVTIEDIRKAILDEIEDVYNVWLDPVLSDYSPDCVKGLYKIYVQMTKEAASGSDDIAKIEARIKDQVIRSFVSKRNLCEDWARDVVILDPVKINISAEVGIMEQAVPEDVLAAIYNRLEDFINPPVRYYSERELLNQGFSVEDIYSGPLLKKGMIPNSEMHARSHELDPDDLVRQIMLVEGVIQVSNLVIRTPEGDTAGKPFVYGALRFPYLEVNPAETQIRLFKGKNEASPKMDAFNDLFLRMREISKKDFISSLHEPMGEGLLKGVNRDLGLYYSIQHHFPQTYGIGEEGLMPGETAERKAQAKQLKAYLLFFEQLLANYLSQLANCKNLFSTDLSGGEALTYYYQPLYGVPGISDLLAAFTEAGKKDVANGWALFIKDPDNEYITAMKSALETDESYRERKNRIFDHLLARFNMQPQTYPANFFNLIYGDPAADERIDGILQWKSRILRNMVALSRDRIKAFDYLAETVNTQDLTGFQKRMAELLYIRNQKRRPLCWVFDLKQPAPDGTGVIHSHLWRGNQELTGVPEQPDHKNATVLSYDFGKQTTAIFKSGIEVDNYKITQDTGKDGGYRILHKAPEQIQWTSLSGTFADKTTAHVALRELINYLTQVNIESEGFHLVEYILLSPALKSPSFGFGFYKNEKERLFIHNEWADFEGREKLIAAILEAENGTGDTSALKGKIQFTDSAASSDTEHWSGRGDLEDQAEEKLQSALAGIRLYKDRHTRFFPRFELCAKLADGTVIREDYFNFRMAVVLPAWPARFQDESFREFAETLFRLNAPAHIKIDFFWLSIFEMKKFEKIYFEWLNALKMQEARSTGKVFSERLIAFLNGKDYYVNHFNR
ncbi:MAG TPA: hypothetical protein VFX43_19940 [Chitinophagaceae bacterium]|nr:hypothetical protein [Chitinophagaceae bacterium]